MTETNEIKEKLEQLEKELFEYRQKRQKELDDYMQSSGINNYVNETNRTIAYFQGKIEALKELLPVDSEILDLK